MTKKVIFYAADKPREIMLAAAFRDGVKAMGEAYEVRRKAEYGENADGSDRKWVGPTVDDTAVAICFGVKADQIFWDHRALGIPVVYIDKGWSRQGGEGGHTEYSRCAVNASSPIAYMMGMGVPHDRLERLGIKFQPHRPNGAGHVIYASSSQKYHEFHKLGDASQLAQKTVTKLKKMTNRAIVYRPKPGDKSAHPVQGAMFSTKAQAPADALRGCHAVVTYGASLCLDALIAGVPSIVLGEGITWPVAGHSLETRVDIEEAPFPNEVEKLKFMAGMAYCQWTTTEMRSGEAWSWLRKQIDKQARDAQQ